MVLNLGARVCVYLVFTVFIMLKIIGSMRISQRLAFWFQLEMYNGVIDFRFVVYWWKGVRGFYGLQAV